MNEVYRKKMKFLDEELGETLPRDVQFKMGLIPFFLFFIPVSGVVCYVMARGINLLFLNNSMSSLHIFLVLLLATGMGFTLFGIHERNIVQNWAKSMGKIENIRMEIGWGSRGGSQQPVVKVNYSYQNESYSAELSSPTMSPGYEEGDPILLLVNPRAPFMCRPYGGFIWRASRKSK